MYYFLGYPIVTDGESVTSAGATNPSYLTDWFTSRKIVTASGTSTTITINLTAAAQVDYVALYDVVIPSAATSYRFRVYDAVSGGGSLLLDSGTIALPKTFTSVSALATTAPDPVQLIHVWTSKATGRAEPSGTSAARSIVIDLAAGSAVSCQVGYLAAGPAVALSSFTAAGGGFDPQTMARGTTTELAGGGITDSRVTATTKYPLHLRQMGESDAETLRELFATVRDTQPFFLYPSDSPTSRALEYGVVRFADSQLPIRQLGTMYGATARYSLSASVTPWR